MRAIASSFLFVALIALAWSVQTPVCAVWNVYAFSRNQCDLGEAEEALIRAGMGALPILRSGLQSTNRDERFHCAKVLLVLGDTGGESYLLRELRAHPDPLDAEGREAEAFLIAAWDRRDGPNDAFRNKLRTVEHAAQRPIEKIQVLNDCLLRYPNWADGYARRARLYQQSGEAFEAKRDALAALFCAPNHFEALVTLGRIQLSVDAPQQAFKCFERAVQVNPRLRHMLKSDFEECIRLIDLEKEKRRDEKRKNVLLV